MRKSLAEISALLDAFIEWDTDDKSVITTNSCLLFAEHVNLTLISQREALIDALKAASNAINNQAPDLALLEIDRIIQRIDGWEHND